jgi:hypothetical protein
MGEWVDLDAGYEGHAYAVVSRVLSGWAFVGEPGKFATGSSKRFSFLGAEEGGALSVTVAGVEGEVVEVCAVHAPADEDSVMVCKSQKLRAPAELVTLEAPI